MFQIAGQQVLLFQNVDLYPVFENIQCFHIVGGRAVSENAALKHLFFFNIRHGDVHVIARQLAVPHHGTGYQFAYAACTQYQNADLAEGRVFLGGIHLLQEFPGQQRVFIQILIHHPQLFIDQPDAVAQAFLARAGKEGFVQIVHRMLGHKAVGHTEDLRALMLIFLFEDGCLFHVQGFIVADQIEIEPLFSADVQVGDAAFHQQHMAQLHRFVCRRVIAAENDIGPDGCPFSVKGGFVLVVQAEGIFPGMLVQLGKDKEALSGDGKQHGCPEPGQTEKGCGGEDGQQGGGGHHKGDPENSRFAGRGRNGSLIAGAGIQLPYFIHGDFHGKNLGNFHQCVCQHRPCAAVRKRSGCCRFRRFRSGDGRCILHVGRILVEGQEKKNHGDGNDGRQQHPAQQDGDPEAAFPGKPLVDDVDNKNAKDKQRGNQKVNEDGRRKQMAHKKSPFSYVP